MLYRVRIAIAVLGLLVVATGWLPPHAAVEVAVTRAGPVLGFLVAVTILAELADAAGVFDAAAQACAKVARGSAVALFGLIAVLASVVTIGMSLDTTAVLLTPVVLAVTTRLGLAPMPFALLVVWLANTASLLLPVSNLTNLLAMQHVGLSPSHFAGRMALPELVAVALTTGYLGIVYGRRVRGRYQVPAFERPADLPLFAVCAVACVGFAVAVTCGVAPWLASTVAAACALAVSAVRARDQLGWSLLPWQLVVTTEGLFLVVAALTRHGLGELLGTLAGGGGLRTVGVAAAAANAMNNLPAYLAMESTVTSDARHRLFDVLLGTNIGPLVTMWGSLATLLWAERCRARGVRIQPLRFAALGIVGVPLVLLGAWAVLPG